MATHPGYSLSFSPLLGNDPQATAVPEPATWALTIAGFGLAAVALRRRRREVAFA